MLVCFFKLRHITSRIYYNNFDVKMPKNLIYSFFKTVMQ